MHHYFIFNYDQLYAASCASKSVASFTSATFFYQGSYPSFTISIIDTFGDPFSCSVSSDCAVGGYLRLQNLASLESSPCSPLCSVLPLVSTFSSCCTSVVGVPQELMEDGIYDFSLFLARGNFHFQLRSLVFVHFWYI